ncbi:MAG: hypothetical protein GY788_25190 [bacterium]|nr:hypothetical protein [bacterium]
MGLYLCVFSNDVEDEEIEGVEVGLYDDFDRFRSTVAERLEDNEWGSRFPGLMLHLDNDGVWEAEEAMRLGEELRQIAVELKQLPSEGFADGWPSLVGKRFGLDPQNLFDTFIDVDGEPLIDRLLHLAKVSVASGRPISFQ